jgi:excisionase family DNA binding protein
MERMLYTVDEVARMLGLGRTKVYELIKLGELTSVQISRARRVPGDAVTAFIARLAARDVEAAVHMLPTPAPEPSAHGETMPEEPDVEEAS